MDERFYAAGVRRMVIKVEDGQVVGDFFDLPRAHKNVSFGLNPSIDSLLSVGLYPVVRYGHDQQYDPAVQELSGPVYSVAGDHVRAEYTVTHLPIAGQVAGKRNRIDLDFEHYLGESITQREIDALDKISQAGGCYADEADDLLDWIDQVTAYYHRIRTQISNDPGTEWDFSVFDARRPNIDVDYLISYTLL